MTAKQAEIDYLNASTVRVGRVLLEEGHAVDRGGVRGPQSAVYLRTRWPMAGL